MTSPLVTGGAERRTDSGRSTRDLLAGACPAKFPGYGYGVATFGSIVESGFGGAACVEPERLPVTKDTLFDLASVTKSLGTAAVALRARHLGLLDLEAAIPEAGDPPISLLDLLRHEAGFPAWVPLYGAGVQREELLPWLLRPCFRGDPRETTVYSCPGYILLGLLLEKALGAPLDALFRELVASPLGLGPERILYNPPRDLRRETAATELAGEFEAGMATERGSLPPSIPEGGLWGVVHDGNARFLGGVSGNSGLFATLDSVAKLAAAFLPASSLFDQDSLALAYGKGAAPLGEYRSAGWKLSESPGWTSGAALPPGCIGHEGFTGTGVWLDPRSERVFVLLTNRVHPRHPRADFGPVRAAFLRAAQGGRLGD